MKIKTALTAFAAMALATAAHAQSGPSVGATVYGPQGNEVGTIEEISDGIAVLNTGKHSVPIPADRFAEGPNGPTIAITKTDLNAAIDQQIAQVNAARDAQLMANAAVSTIDGAPAGMVKSIEGDNILMSLTTGDEATLLREQFSVDQTGSLIVLFTQADLMAALGSAAPAAE